jgi:hypothetical protein
MSLVENLSPFFADFGDAGTLAGAPVRGIFDAAVRDQLGVLAADPSFQLPTAQVPANAFGAALVVPQGSYTVREHLPDGTGMSLLLLSKA